MSIQPVNVNPMPPAGPARVRPHGAEVASGVRGSGTGISGTTQGTQGAYSAEGARARSATAAARSGSTVPSEAPAGTDPMLWSVLTSEERSFFARAHAMGQVTYGPGSGSARAGMPLGGRVDVRV